VLQPHNWPLPNVDADVDGTGGIARRLHLVASLLFSANHHKQTCSLNTNPYIHIQVTHVKQPPEQTPHRH
jgi:hypothetical protein